MSVVYAAYAAPGMMKMGLGCGSLGLEVGVGWEAVRSLEPRARVSVWPGRRRVPGIVAPDSWGARGAECLPRDVLRRSSPATSPCDGTTARRCLCHGTGSGTTEARPPASSVPPAPHGGLGVLSRHLVNSGPDFRSRTKAWFNYGSQQFPRSRFIGAPASAVSGTAWMRDSGTERPSSA